MSEGRIVGIDLDRVVVDKTSFIRRKIAELFDRDIPEGNIGCPKYWLEHTSLNQQAAAGFVLALELEGDKGIELMPGAAEAMERHANEGTRLHIITARSVRVKSRVEEMLNRLGLSPLLQDVHFSQNPYFNCSRPSKAEICDKIKADVLLDDSLPDILDVVRVGKFGMLFGNDVWSTIPDNVTNVVRVSGWEDVDFNRLQPHEG